MIIIHFTDKIGEYDYVEIYGKSIKGYIGEREVNLGYYEKEGRVDEVMEEIKVMIEFIGNIPLFGVEAALKRFAKQCPNLSVTSYYTMPKE